MLLNDGRAARKEDELLNSDTVAEPVLADGSVGMLLAALLDDG